MPIDYSKYPPNWEEIVARITKRSKGKCEFCGLKNHSLAYSIPFNIRQEGSYKIRRVWFRDKRDAIREAIHEDEMKKVRVILTVAHLDHDETNWKVKDERLAHLCQMCHVRYDAKEKYKRVRQKGWTVRSK